MIEQRLKEIFLDVIQIEGLSCDEKSVAEYVKSFLIAKGFDPFEDESKDKTASNTGNIICRVGGGGDFILSAHMDTARTTKGVTPQFNSDRITSDGTTVLGIDNRAGIAILLYLAEKISLGSIETKDFTFVFTTCEETTLDGSRHISLNGTTKKGFVFDSYLSPGYFVNEAFGAASFTIAIHGKAAHSGIEPEKGINALQIASNAISKLQLGQYNDSTTLNIGKFYGGSGVNVIPELTHLEGEIRSKSMQGIIDCYDDLQKIFAQEAAALNGKVNLQFRWDFHSYFLDSDSMVYQDISNAIINAGLEPKPANSRGGSDANSYNERGIPAVNIGIGAQNPHSNEEFILYDDFINAYKIAVELVRKS